MALLDYPCCGSRCLPCRQAAALPTDRGHALSSLPPPPAAVASLPLRYVIHKHNKRRVAFATRRLILRANSCSVRWLLFAILFVGTGLPDGPYKQSLFIRTVREAGPYDIRNAGGTFPWGKVPPAFKKPRSKKLRGFGVCQKTMFFDRLQRSKEPPRQATRPRSVYRYTRGGSEGSAAGGR